MLNNFHSTHRSNNVTNDKNVKMSVNFLRVRATFSLDKLSSQQQRTLSLMLSPLQNNQCRSHVGAKLFNDRSSNSNI